MSRPPNPHEERARRRKAEAIVDLVWNELEPEARIDPTTIDLFRGCTNQSARDAIAGMAGQRSPSEETWCLVVSGITQRIRDARWGASQARRSA